IFHYTLEKFSIQATDTLFIDDSQANITTARQLGFQTVLFDRSAECYQQIRTLLSLKIAQSGDWLPIKMPEDHLIATKALR
ncbi:MAG: HAD-IA family hydrolase, partial [Pseudomonadales bacterium]|nr:HAD-IA family hydrolase [Pseudomonadales bacterium]